jgi:programmed cell death protein 5
MDISQLKPATPGGANGGDETQAQDAAAKRAQEEQMKHDLLSTVLESDARERCKHWPFVCTNTLTTDRETIGYFSIVSRIALVNPQLSNQVEGILLRMAQSGQLRGQMTETQLIGLLDQVHRVSSLPRNFRFTQGRPMQLKANQQLRRAL